MKLLKSHHDASREAESIAIKERVLFTGLNKP